MEHTHEKVKVRSILYDPVTGVRRLQVRNYNHENVWGEFEGMIFVECKNWSRPVGSKEIDNFKGKLERNGIHAGILVATMGVTGSGLGGARGQSRGIFKAAIR